MRRLVIAMVLVAAGCANDVEPAEPVDCDPTVENPNGCTNRTECFNFSPFEAEGDAGPPFCIPLCELETDPPCPDGWVCREKGILFMRSTCVVPCATDSDCPASMRCWVSAAACVR